MSDELEKRIEALEKMVMQSIVKRLGRKLMRRLGNLFTLNYSFKDNILTISWHEGEGLLRIKTLTGKFLHDNYPAIIRPLTVRFRRTYTEKTWDKWVCTSITEKQECDEYIYAGV